MAEVFRPVYHVDPSTAKRVNASWPGAVRKKSPTWWIRYYTPDGKRHKVTVRRGGTVLHIDTVNVFTATARAKFLDALAEDFEEMRREVDELERENVRVKEENARHRETEATLKETLLLAQRSADADRGRLAHLQVQVGSVEFDQGAEELVDLELPAVL